MLEVPDFTQFEITDIISFLITPPFPEYFLLMKIIFILSFLFFLVLLLYFYTHSTFLKLAYGDMFMDFLTKKTYAGKSMDKAWLEIKGKIDSKEEADYKMAIIEADDLLDEVLKKIGYKGASFDDRLENITPVHLTNLEEVKKVHEIRVKIVRDPGYSLSFSEAKKIIDVYETSFKELEVF